MSSDDTRPEVIGSIADVARWLRAQGYCAPGKDKPSRNSKKLYEDRKKGLLICADPKAITMIEAMAYVARAMLSKTGVRRADEIEDLAVLLKKVEYEIKQEDLKRKKFENEKEIGLYILKTDAHMTMAIKIAALEALHKHLYRTYGAEYILLSDGDPGKAPLVSKRIYSDLDDLLNQVGRMGEIGVVVVNPMTDPGFDDGSTDDAEVLDA